MEIKESRTHSLIVTGIGGRGVLSAGRILAEAAVTQYPHILWLPTLTTAMRGDPCECYIVLSDKPIASINVWMPDDLVAVDSSRLKTFEQRVKSGGLIITEQAGANQKVQRTDVKVLEVPALQMAVDMGDPMVANLILLGNYVGLTKIVSPKAIEANLTKKFSGREMVLTANKQAFRVGLGLAENH